MQPTEQQRAAIHTHDKNLIVIAGAGSGKTRVLVERFLALLEANSDWPLNALVAITFTRKAAGEMRDRVRQSLEEQRIQAIQARDMDRARRWADLLAAMDSARIGTIHSLCSDLLRANAAEAGLDPGFDVMDEAEASALRSDVVEDTVASLAETDPPSPALILFDDYSESQIKEVLDDAALLSSDLPDMPDDLLGYWIQQWEQALREEVAMVAGSSAAQAVMTWEPASGLPAPSDDKLAAQWYHVLDELEHVPYQSDSELLYEWLFNLQQCIDLRVGSKKIWGVDEFKEAKAILGALRDLIKGAFEGLGEPPGAIDERAAELLPAWWLLIKQVQERYHTEKHQRSMLDFDDLENLSMKLLQEHPQVVARYRGAEFKHLLVDEFQDTNSRQWAIVRALAGVDAPGSLFVVGDPKQSIYAFRGADVSVFGQVQAEITNAQGVPLDLSTSFRSHRPLINGLNRLFEQILVQHEGSPVRDYQVTFGRAMEAFREIPPAEIPPIHLLLLNKEKHPIETLRRWEAREIALTLRAMIEAKRPVHDKATNEIRPMRYGDIAILFRALTSVNLYEEVFRAMELPFITLAGRGYYDRQEVQDLINLLRALHNPADNLSLAAALHSPLFSLSSEALYALRQTGLSLWESLVQPGPLFPERERATLTFAQDALYRLHDAAGRVTISELLRAALDATGFLATLTGLPNGAQRRGNVEKLLTLAQSAGKVTLSAFSHYLEDLSTAEVREGDAALETSDVVQIMSVHASKGLEFPVVVLGDISRSRTASRHLVTYHGDLACKVLNPEDGRLEQPFIYRREKRLANLREDAELARLLYVAATRARDYLVLSGQGNVQKWSGGGWLGWLLPLIEEQDETFAIHTPEYPEDDSIFTDGHAPDQKAAWERHALRQGEPLPGPVTPPRLLGTLNIRHGARARHLSATSIAQLGSALQADSADERERSKNFFRRKVFFDAPTHIRAVTDVLREPQSDQVSMRQIGNVVHEALRYWHFNTSNAPDVRQLLESYAWETGITLPENVQYAVDRAYDLLQRFRNSDLFQQIETAKQVFRELPFIYERDAHIVHGIIDVLYQRPDETWAVVDYKASWVPNHRREGMFDYHARRYHMQVGIYAEAVRAQLGVRPAAHIHYIRYGVTVTIPPESWETALSGSLGTYIDALDD